MPWIHSLIKAVEVNKNKEILRKKVKMKKIETFRTKN